MGIVVALRAAISSPNVGCAWIQPNWHDPAQLFQTLNHDIADLRPVSELTPRRGTRRSGSVGVHLPCGENAQSNRPVSKLRTGRASDLPWIALVIASLVMSPFGLDHNNFVVVEEEGASSDQPSLSAGERLGFAQIRPVGDAGASLLASLFVIPSARNSGVGSRLVRALLDRRGSSSGPIYALTLSRTEPFFKQLGFRQVDSDNDAELPAALSLEASLGRIIAPIVAGVDLVVLRYDV